MKRMRKFRDCWQSIHLIDQFLIVIMAILLVYSLWIGGNMPGVSRDVGIMVRTTIASIFGYFISSNFVKTEETGQKLGGDNAPRQQTISQSGGSPPATGKMGFSADSDISPDAEDLVVSAAANVCEESKWERPQNQLQIQIVGILCILSILALIYLDYGSEDLAASAAMSQFRDIVCGGIGFLIGTPNSKRKQ